MFNKTEYILIKTDQEYAISYANQTFIDLIGQSEEQLLGQNFDEVWKPETPSAIRRYGFSRLAKQNFYNGYAPYRCNKDSKKLQWIFFDFGKRYSLDGEWRGYEYFGYPPSQRGVDHFDNLFSELAELERNQSNNEGAEAADQFLQQHIRSMGSSYEELVCTLQDL